MCSYSKKNEIVPSDLSDLSVGNYRYLSWENGVEFLIHVQSGSVASESLNGNLCAAALPRRQVSLPSAPETCHAEAPCNIVCHIYLFLRESFTKKGNFIGKVSLCDILGDICFFTRKFHEEEGRFHLQVPSCNIYTMPYISFLTRKIHSSESESCFELKWFHWLQGWIQAGFLKQGGCMLAIKAKVTPNSS